MSAPITSDALLDLADDLVRTDEASTTVRLRCAVSAAYYALFHGLVADAAPGRRGRSETRDGPAPDQPVVQPRELRSVSEWVLRRAGGRSVPTRVAGLLDDPPPELVKLAASFLDLQHARHEADYDHQLLLNREEAVVVVGEARRALRLTAGLAGTRVYENYLVLLGAARRVAR